MGALCTRPTAFTSFCYFHPFYQAALAATRIVQKVPDLNEMYVRAVRPLLNEKKHGNHCHFSPIVRAARVQLDRAHNCAKFG